MANASSDSEEFSRMHEEVESLLKAKDARITELENRLASDSEEFNRTHEEVEILLKAKDARITELENRLAEQDKLLELINLAREEEYSGKIEGSEEFLNFGKWQATEESRENLSGLTEAQESRELLGGFATSSHLFHGHFRMEMRIPYQIFLSMLEKEGLFYGENDRWSGPLHTHLAGKLKLWGFSIEDWDFSLLRKDNGDPIYSYTEEVDAIGAEHRNPVSPSRLSKEQLSLIERIATLYRTRVQKDKQIYYKCPDNWKAWRHQVWSALTPEMMTRAVLAPESGAFIEYHPEDWRMPMSVSV